jgi:hypothetical protein
LITTTDNTGVNGFTGGDYNDHFNGTSAGCPNAAAVVALILSINPNLTGQAARNILERTCFKIPNGNFQANVSGQPNGTWSNQAGYGRVDAAMAVREALLPLVNISGDFRFCTTSNNYSITNLPAGATVQWQANPSYLVTINSPNATQTTITRNYDGAFTLSATITLPCNVGQVNLLSMFTIVAGPPTIDFVQFNNPNGSAYGWCSNLSGNVYTISSSDNDAWFDLEVRAWPSYSLVYSSQGGYTGTSGYLPSGFYIFRARGSNSCGTGNWYETEVENYECTGGGGEGEFRILATPNPATGNLYVKINQKKSAAIDNNKDEKIQYLLYDTRQANPLRQWTFTNTPAYQRLDIHGIKAGQYVLVVRKGKWRQSTQVIIQ